MSISEILKDPKFKENLIKNVGERINKENQIKKDFFESSICKKIIEEIKTKDYILNNKNFIYYSEDVCKNLNWNDDITKKDIALFFDCMSYNDLPKDKENTIDETCFFENKTIYRCGLSISLVFGQGTSIIIQKQK